MKQSFFPASQDDQTLIPLTDAIWKHRDSGPISQPPTAAKSDPREFQLVKLKSGEISVETMIYRPSELARRPLFIVNSIEFSMAPSVDFCEFMWEQGLQVIFIRRLGFGGTPGLPRVLLQAQNIRSGAAVATEAAILHQLISQLELKNVVLLGIGSGNPVCYRLCRLNSQITLSVFSNAVFNQDSWKGFRPAWFGAMLRQTVMTQNGFRIAARGLKFYMRKHSDNFFQQMLQKSKGDQKYVADNLADARIALDLQMKISSKIFFYDLTMSMREDPSLRDGYFDDIPAIVLSGLETTDEWLSETRREAERLNVPIVHADLGGMMVAYASREKLAEIIKCPSEYGASTIARPAAPPARSPKTQ